MENLLFSTALILVWILSDHNTAASHTRSRARERVRRGLRERGKEGEIARERSRERERERERLQEHVCVKTVLLKSQTG